MCNNKKCFCSWVLGGLALLSLAFSLWSWFTGKVDQAIFTGLWVPSLLALKSFCSCNRCMLADDCCDMEDEEWDEEEDEKAGCCGGGCGCGHNHGEHEADDAHAGHEHKR